MPEGAAALVATRARTEVTLVADAATRGIPSATPARDAGTPVALGGAIVTRDAGTPVVTAVSAAATLVAVMPAMTTTRTAADAVAGGVAGGTVTRLSTARSEEHTSELQSLRHLVCRLRLD